MDRAWKVTLPVHAVHVCRSLTFLYPDDPQVWLLGILTQPGAPRERDREREGGDKRERETERKGGVEKRERKSERQRQRQKERAEKKRKRQRETETHRERERIAKQCEGRVGESKSSPAKSDQWIYNGRDFLK